MITVIDSAPWSPINLTGNSALGWVGTSAYVIGSSRGDSSQGLYKSVTSPGSPSGLAWALIAQIAAPAGSLNPVMVVDGTLLHIVLARPSVDHPALWDVYYYTFDTVASVMSNGVALITGSQVVSSYDVIALGNGKALVVTTSFRAAVPEGYTDSYVLWAFEVSNLGDVVSTVLQAGPWQSGLTVGGLSLLAPDGDPVELYYATCPRMFSFADSQVTLQVQTRSGANTWDPPTPIHTYTARIIDNKLSALITPDGRRVVAQTYYLQNKYLGLVPSIVYGVGTAGSWTFGGIPATVALGFKEPVLESDGTNVTMAYLVCPAELDKGRYADVGGLAVADLDLDTLSAISRSGGWVNQKYKWIRGTKAQVPVDAQWALVGLSGTDDMEGTGYSWYLSGHVIPPVVVLSPSTAQVVRGIPFVLDASQTTDLDSLSLTYVWSLNSADTTNVHLTPAADGRSAKILVDLAIGPEAYAFQVRLAVTDLSGNTVQAQAALTIPVQPEVTITMPPDQDVTRNTSTTLTAAVTNPLGVPLTYLWQQVAGDAVTLLGTEQLTLTAQLYGTDVAGEVVTLRFSAMDGVNPPVSAVVNLNVSGIPDVGLDKTHWCRSYFTRTDTGQPATLADRHSALGSWPDPHVSDLFSDFVEIKASSTASGQSRLSYVSAHSCLTLGTPTDSPQPYYYRAYPPVGWTLIDAYHDEDDQTYLLAADASGAYAILRYTSPGVAGTIDWPDEVFQLGAITSSGFSSISALATTGDGTRVIILWGTSGALLLQVNETTFTSMDFFPIIPDTGLIPYPNIQWLRVQNVVNLKSGRMLIGLLDNSGGPIEVLIDLAAGRQLQLWDRSNFASALVTTGEILGTQTAASIPLNEEAAWVTSDWVDSNWVDVG